MMAEMIFVLNEHGIIPDLLCFRSSVDQIQAVDFYGRQLRFNIVKIGFEPPMPFEWNMVWFNIRVSKYLKHYDVVINHNNTSFGLIYHGHSINYIHFPRKSRLASNLRDMHQPEKGKTPIANPSRDLLNLMRWFYRFDRTFGDKEKILANSYFTKQALLTAYVSLKDKDVEVLYPPVSTMSQKSSLGSTKKVVSLGRIASAKRQLEQIKIAERLPNHELTIIGFVSEPDYYQKCLDYIKANKVQNVRVLGDASKIEVDKTLAEAAFFIHSMRSEPFGITSVQAIVHGCLPIVHNSGGQQEVVAEDSLRYSTISDAVDKINELTQLEPKILEGKLYKLQEHIKTYDVIFFKNRFEKILLNILK